MIFLIANFRFPPILVSIFTFVFSFLFVFVSNCRGVGSWMSLGPI